MQIFCLLLSHVDDDEHSLASGCKLFDIVKKKNCYHKSKSCICPEYQMSSAATLISVRNDLLTLKNQVADLILKLNPTLALVNKRIKICVK